MLGSAIHARRASSLDTSTADVIVFKEGDYAVAVDGKTKEVIARSRDHAEVIQKAINALTSGRTWKENVMIIGNYEVSDTIRIPSYTILQIFGKIVMKKGIYKNIIENNDPTNGNTEIMIIGGEIDGGEDTLSSGKNGIVLRNIKKCVVMNVSIRRVFWGIQIGDSSSVDGDENIIAHNHIDWVNSGIVINGHENIIAKNVITRIKGYGLYPRKGNDNLWMGNIVKDVIPGSSTGVGMGLEYPAPRQIVIGLEVSGIVERAISFIGGYGAGSVLIGLNIHDNPCTERDEAIRIGSSITLALSEIYNNGKSGIIIDGDHNLLIGLKIHNNKHHGVWFASGADYNLLLSSSIYENSEEEAGSYYGIFFYNTATHNKVVNCEIFDDRDTPKQGYGIYESGDADYNIFENNMLHGHVHGQIVIVGVNTKARKNTGYPTEKSGVAVFSGDGSTTQFKVEHGLVSTPSKVIVTPLSADAKDFAYAEADDTYIYFNFDTAPPAGTDNVKLSWHAEI